MRRDNSRIKQIIEKFKAFLLPTSTEHFKAIERDVASCYSNDIYTLERDRDTLKYLVLASRSKRMEVLGQLRSELPCGAVRKRYGKEIHGPNVSDNLIYEKVQRFSTLESDVEPLTPDQEVLLNTYLHYVKTSRLLREHLEEIDKDLEEFKYTVKTQAVAELTNYRGINDWGETMRAYVSNYAKSLGALSIAGAGLVYSTIFTNSDKGLGLMSLTFPLFTVGFLIPGFVYIGTCWAANVPKGLTFASQRFWTAAMVFSLLVASIMAIGAIVIVNITIFRLNAGAKYHGSLTLVEIAGIISLIFSGSIISMAIIALFLGLLSQKMRTSIKEYYQTITEKERNALNTYNHL